MVEGGEHKVIVAYDGFRSESQAITLEGDQSDYVLNLNITLHKNGSSWYLVGGLVLGAIFTTILVAFYFLDARNKSSIIKFQCSIIVL